MSEAQSPDLARYCEETARAARSAAVQLTGVPGGVRNQWLRSSAERLRKESEHIWKRNPCWNKQGRTVGMKIKPPDEGYVKQRRLVPALALVW